MEEYDFNQLKKEDYFTMIVLGGTNSGKTFITKHILNELYGIFNHVFLFLGSSDGLDNNYEQYIWNDHIFRPQNNTQKEMKQYVEDKLKNITNWTKNISEHYKNNMEDRPKILCIFDDMGATIKYALNNITNLSRHSKLSFIFLIHDYTQLDPTTRKSLTHYILCSKSAYTNLIEEYYSSKEKARYTINIISRSIESYKETNDKIYYVLDKSFFDKVYYYTLNEKQKENVRNSNYKWSHASIVRSSFIESLHSIINKLNSQQH